MNTKEALGRILEYLETQDPDTYDQNIYGMKFGSVDGPVGLRGCLLRTAFLAGVPTKDIDLHPEQDDYLFCVDDYVRAAAQRNNWPCPEPMDIEATKVRVRFVLGLLEEK